MQASSAVPGCRDIRVQPSRMASIAGSLDQRLSNPQQILACRGRRAIASARQDLCLPAAGSQLPWQVVEGEKGGVRGGETFGRTLDIAEPEQRQGPSVAEPGEGR